MSLLPSRTFTDPATGLTLPYRLFVPSGCSPLRPCGLLLVLHGAGERGDDNQAQLRNQVMVWAETPAQDDWPTAVVYPQCPSGMKWVDVPWDGGSYALAATPPSRPMRAAIGLLEAVRSQLPVEADRLLVTGLSMGGYGTWDLLARHPALFAAALPICGGGDPQRASSFRHVPIWAFHGARDPAVPVQASRDMIQALRSAGAEPRYDELADAGHEVWTHAFEDLRVVRWLLSQRKRATGGAGSV